MIQKIIDVIEALMPLILSLVITYIIFLALQ